MENNSFARLGVSFPICEALQQKNILEPTPVQEQMIPQILEESDDVIALAATGTGKTAAFGVPLLQFAEEDQSPCQSLVLTPTRELALQVSKELESMAAKLPVKVLPLYGGRQIQPQIKALKQNSYQIIVGTPGRILDHIKSKRLKIDKLRFLVLDEADEMLDIGFQDELEAILSVANPERQTLLFSATMSKKVKSIAKGYLVQPSQFDFRTEHKRIIELNYYQTNARAKKEGLCRILESVPGFYGLIFCRRKTDVDELSEFLREQGFAAAGLHGDLSSSGRETVLKQFRSKYFSILVATDVAARGLDISNLNTVINYALPDTAEALMHRIGRTGRAGKSGLAILLLTSTESRKLKQYEKSTGLNFEKKEFLSPVKLAKLKQDRAREDLLRLFQEGDYTGYLDLANQLIKLSSPDQVIAGLLQQLHGKSLLTEAYSEIPAASTGKKPSRKQEFTKNSRRPNQQRSKAGSFRPKRKKNGTVKAKNSKFAGKRVKIKKVSKAAS